MTDTEKAVLETIRNRLSTVHSLIYLTDHGFSISRATYFRIKKKLEDTKLERLHHIAKIGFLDQHLDTLDRFEFVEKKMREDYNKEQSPYKRVEILTQIVNLQPFISKYYESTFYVLKKSKELV